MPRELEYLRMTHEIGSRVGAGVLDRKANPCLRREMHDHVNFFVRRGCTQKSLLGDVTFCEPKPWLAAQQVKPCLFERYGIVRVDFIDPGDGMTAVQQRS